MCHVGQYVHERFRSEYRWGLLLSMIDVQVQDLYEAAGNIRNLTLLPMDPKSLVFEERVRLNCFYCKNYNFNWRCPPRIPELDYRHVMSEYKNGLFVKGDFPFNDRDFSEVRTQSTNTLHSALLKMEKYLWDNNYPMAVSFIGGSCKLCKSGCGKERCNNPGSARIPIEAAGINVVASVQKARINLVFPPQNILVRIGMLLW